MKRYDALIYLIKKYEVNSMLEIGVGSGITADTIMKMYPDMEYIGIDPYKEYPNDVNGEKKRIEQNRSSALEVFKKHTGGLLWQSSSQFVYESQVFSKYYFDLIFIDGEHTYESCSYDTNNWYKRLSMNGIIVWHDYDRVQMFPGVKQAVDEFVAVNGLFLFTIGDLVYVRKP